MDPPRASLPFPTKRPARVRCHHTHCFPGFQETEAERCLTPARDANSAWPPRTIQNAWPIAWFEEEQAVETVLGRAGDAELHRDIARAGVGHGARNS